MARVLIVGDGPGGLSAALFLAKNGHEALVFGTDDTAVRAAHLHNYLGAPDMLGDDFQESALAQATAAGATISMQRVLEIVAARNGFAGKLDDGRVVEADYVILSEGKVSPLADLLGLRRDGRAVDVDRDYRSSVDRVYAVGRSARPKRSQAIISAGAGATAALDILAREAGKDVQDWDTPSVDETAQRP